MINKIIKLSFLVEEDQINNVLIPLISLTGKINNGLKSLQNKIK
jgi:hypothetical protein